MATGGCYEMSSENPRIGKVLRVPIEIVTEDEDKIQQLIRALADAPASELASDLLEHEKDVIKSLEKTNLGDLFSLGKEHIANLLGFAKNPSGFILATFLRKFAKGAGAIALAFIIMEAIRFGIEFLMRDGMPLDRRFKRYVQNEVIGFLDRLFKAELRQGFRSVITTTIGGLRGGQNQVSGNQFAIAAGNISTKIPTNFYAIPVSSSRSKGLRNTLRHTANGRFG